MVLLQKDQDRNGGLGLRRQTVAAVRCPSGDVPLDPNGNAHIEYGGGFVRTIILVFLTVVAAAALYATNGMARPDGSGAVTADKPTSEQRLLGVHHLSLKDGVNPEEFERFIIEEFNPVLSGVFPGVHMMVMKGERGAEEGEYLLVYDAQSLYVRDWYWPTPGESSEASTAVMEACGDACSAARDRYQSMAETTLYTDYVQLVHD
jgi:hypothetical protein